MNTQGGKVSEIHSKQETSGLIIYFMQCISVYSATYYCPLLTTCFGCTLPSSGVSNSLRLLHCTGMECPTSHITCECDISWLIINKFQFK
jgi:hypothetical protein